MSDPDTPFLEFSLDTEKNELALRLRRLNANLTLAPVRRAVEILAIMNKSTVPLLSSFQLLPAAPAESTPPGMSISVAHVHVELPLPGSLLVGDLRNVLVESAQSHTTDPGLALHGQADVDLIATDSTSMPVLSTHLDFFLGLPRNASDVGLFQLQLQQPSLNVSSHLVLSVIRLVQELLSILPKNEKPASPPPASAPFRIAVIVPDGVSATFWDSHPDGTAAVFGTVKITQVYVSIILAGALGVSVDFDKAILSLNGFETNTVITGSKNLEFALTLTDIPGRSVLDMKIVTQEIAANLEHVVPLLGYIFGLLHGIDEGKNRKEATEPGTPLDVQLELATQLLNVSFQASPEDKVALDGKGLALRLVAADEVSVGVTVVNAKLRQFGRAGRHHLLRSNFPKATPQPAGFLALDFQTNKKEHSNALNLDVKSVRLTLTNTLVVSIMAYLEYFDKFVSQIMSIVVPVQEPSETDFKLALRLTEAEVTFTPRHLKDRKEREIVISLPTAVGGMAQNQFTLQSSLRILCIESRTTSNRRFRGTQPANSRPAAVLASETITILSDTNFHLLVDLTPKQPLLTHVTTEPLRLSLSTATLEAVMKLARELLNLETPPPKPGAADTGLNVLVAIPEIQVAIAADDIDIGLLTLQDFTFAMAPALSKLTVKSLTLAKSMHPDQFGLILTTFKAEGAPAPPSLESNLSDSECALVVFLEKQEVGSSTVVRLQNPLIIGNRLFYLLALSDWILPGVNAMLEPYPDRPAGPPGDSVTKVLIDNVQVTFCNLSLPAPLVDCVLLTAGAALTFVAVPNGKSKLQVGLSDVNLARARFDLKKVKPALFLPLFSKFFVDVEGEIGPGDITTTVHCSGLRGVLALNDILALSASFAFEPSPVPPQPNTEATSSNVTKVLVRDVEVKLLDDQNGLVPVVRLKVQDLGYTLSMINGITQAEYAVSMSADYFHFRGALWEPLLEPWSITLTNVVHPGELSTTVDWTALSETPLVLNITHGFLIGGFQALSSWDFSKAPQGLVARSYYYDLQFSNRSGQLCRFWIWEESNPTLLAPDAAIGLSLSRNVANRLGHLHKNLQVTLADGTKLPPVSLSSLNSSEVTFGSYFFSFSTQNGQRTVTLYSLVSFRNHTDLELEVRLRDQVGQQLYVVEPKCKISIRSPAGDAAKLAVRPIKYETEEGSAWSADILLAALPRTGKPLDHFRKQNGKIGFFTCHEGAKSQPKYGLSTFRELIHFAPLVTLQNLLPVPIVLRMYEKETTVQPGAELPVYEADYMTRSISVEFLLPKKTGWSEPLVLSREDEQQQDFRITLTDEWGAHLHLFCFPERGRSGHEWRIGITCPYWVSSISLTCR